MTHPIRAAKIHTFERRDSHDGGANWVGQFHPYKTYPVTFYGVDEQEVLEKARLCAARQSKSTRLSAYAARKQQSATASANLKRRPQND